MILTACLQLHLGDSVLIWRVWVVWNHDYRVVLLPVTLLLTGFGTLQGPPHLTPTDRCFDPCSVVVGMMYAAEATSYNFLSKILPMPSVVLGVANTTICTTLIAGRLACVTL